VIAYATGYSSKITSYTYSYSCTPDNLVVQRMLEVTDFQIYRTMSMKKQIDTTAAAKNKIHAPCFIAAAKTYTAFNKGISSQETYREKPAKTYFS